MRTLRLVLAIGLASVATGGAARPLSAGDGPPAPAPAPAPPYVLSAIEGDPAGFATKLDHEAAARLDPAHGTVDPEGAARNWMQLVESGVSSLLPVPRAPWDFVPAAPEDGLYAPAAEVALARLARLPASARDLVEARWGPAAAEALAAACARAGRSTDALEAIATRYPVTDAGAKALLLLADRRLESGRDVEAVRQLWRWLRFRVPPVEPPAHAASVLARLFEALVRLEDARGVAAASRVTLLIPGASAVVDGVRRDVADMAGIAMDAVRARIATRILPSPTAPPPSDPTLLWTLDVSDPKLVGGRGVGTGLPSARVTVDGDSLYVCDARRVRRVDRWTGLVRWSYPAADALPRDFDPAERSRPFEAPVRDVVTAGGLVLAVLGSPPVSALATFLHDGAVVHGSHLARETRTRIVALDSTDGHPVWWSGRLDEADPVVGAPDVAVTSPLLVDGDTVSAVVAARRGLVETWLATFDLATGRVRRTTYLARAESGLVVPAPLNAERTLEEDRTRGLPRAQRPVRTGDEIAVVTGTGFVAGVAAGTGRLRWVEALPGYALANPSESESSGYDPVALGIENVFSPSNEPVAGFGAWFVAAEDASFVVAIEIGTGRLRWVATESRRSAGADDTRSVGLLRDRHLVGLLTDGSGRASVAFSGWSALELRDASSGALVRELGVHTWPGAEPFGFVVDVGRPLLEGATLRAVRGGRLHLLAPWPDSLGPWRETGERPAVPSNAGPVEGDLVRAGDAWIVVGPERVIALAGAAETLAAARAPGSDAADRAARACLLARTAPSRGALAAAVAASASEPAVRTQLLPGAVDALFPSADGLASIDDAGSLASLFSLVDALEPADRARAYFGIFRGLELMKRDARIVELLDAWLAFGDRALLDYYEPAGRIRVRSDLYASDVLPVAAGRSAPGRAALERRERAAEAALAGAKDLGESALVEAIRRAGGTRAAWLARFDLLALRIDAGRFGDAAATAADLRTSAPDLRQPPRAAVGIDLGSAAAHGLRGLEADLLARAGEGVAAREALFDADRDGPALARTLDGGPSALLARRLERGSGGPAADADPPARIELFPGERTPSEQARRAAMVLEPGGPGSLEDVDRILVARGLELEVRSLSTGAAVPVTPVDASFLGAVLQDRETAVPGPGVRIASVTAGGAADRAGLRAGDWIVRWGGRDATDRASLLREIAQAPAGAVVAVEALRGARRLPVDVTPARRTADDRAPPTPTRAVYAGDGTAIVPSRFGLSRVNLATGDASSIWRSRHRGEVTEALGFAGTTFALVEAAPLADTTVVAVDQRSGAERWVTTIEGATSTPPRVVGSGLVVDTDEPTRTWILDRETGSVRGSYARADAVDVAAGRTGHAPEPQTSVDAGGSIWLWREGNWLTSIDPASGMRRADHSPAVTGGLLPRPLAGGGVVASAAVSDTLEILLPDLRGGIEPFGRIRVDGTRFGTHISGALDFLSRLAVGGDCVYIARVTTEKRAVIGAIEIDRRAARGLVPGDAVNWHPGEALLKPQSSVATSTRPDVWPVFAAMRATLDGVWVCATYWDVGLEGAPGRSGWFEPVDHDDFSSIPTESSTLYARGPVFVGAHVLLPTDGGYLVVPRRGSRR